MEQVVLVGRLHTQVVVRRVHKRAPNDKAVDGRQGRGEHVGPLQLGAVVHAGARLPLRVGFEQKAAKRRDGRVELLGLAGPKRLHLLVQRVSRRQIANGHGSREARAQHGLNAPRCK